MFNLEFLQLINDWQSIGTGKNKLVYGKKLKKLSRSFPLKFRKVDDDCYRRIDLNGKNAIKLGVYTKLSETFSSWTLDSNVAENFNNGVPPQNYQGVIFRLPANVVNKHIILNLDELYKDPTFCNECNKNEKSINNFTYGIGYYRGKEKEVILEIDSLEIKNIFAYGGFSSDSKVLAYSYFGHEPTEDELTNFENLIKKANIKIGEKWLKGEAKNRVVAKHIIYSHFFNNWQNGKIN